MRLQLLYEETYQVVGTLNGDRCETVDFLFRGERSTAASRKGLVALLERVAKDGLDGMPVALVHLVDKDEKIYEFIKGDLRLFFFKGVDNQIAICTSGSMKKSQKADKSAVAKAATQRKAYFAASDAKNIEVID